MSLILIPSFLYTEIFFKVSTSCAVEKYIKETDSKQSAIAMYEIQDSLSQLRINKQYQEKDTHKKLY